MIERSLRAVRRDVAGVQAVMLVDGQGMLVAAVGGQRSTLDVVAASYTDLVRRAAGANREADLEDTDEMIVTGGFGAVVYQGVTGEYGLLALLTPRALVGQARFALRHAAAALVPELTP
jgi:predicted regulator of Ras-like GTPase activity (Roadblock/LC7/MglB family)